MKKPQPTPFIISFLTLRKIIGVLGIALPAILLSGDLAFGRCTGIQDSISHYYYTTMGDVFVGILCMVGLFLMSYRGYEPIDRIAASLAGVSALLVAFFATSNPEKTTCATRLLNEDHLREIVHFSAAALFFVTLAFMTIFLFTKSAGQKTPEKKLRNKLYRACGLVILGAILLILLIKQIDWLQVHLARFKPVFWLEWIALGAFGTSWLIKGKFIFDD